MVPFETNIADAAERKVYRYQDLSDACACSHHTTIIMLEVGTKEFKKLYKLLRAKATDRQLSYDIWCSQFCMTYSCFFYYPMTYA